MRSRPLLLHATLVLCVACSSGQSGGAPEASPTPPTTAATPAPGSETGRSQKPDYTVEGLRHPGRLPGTASFNAKRGRATTVGGLAVTPEGGVFAVVNQTADVGNGTITLKQSQLEVLQPKRRAVKVRGSTGAKARQAVYGDADTDHLVWMETTSTDLTHQPWVLLLSVRRSGVTRVLASSPEDAPAPPSGTVPTLAEGRVYWSAAQRTSNEERPVRANIYSRDLAGSSPVRLEVKDAMMPSADGRFMFYATSSFLSPSLAEGSASIHRLDLRTGADSVVQDLQLGADDTLAGLASSGDDVAWIVNTAPGGENAKGRATLYLREGGAPARSIGGDGKTFATPVMTERLVGWTDAGESGDEWIFDRDSRKVTLLARAPGLASVLAAGAHLCWRDRDRWRSATLPSR